MDKLVNGNLSAKVGTTQNSFPDIIMNADLLELLPSMVASFDKEFKIGFANRAFHKCFYTTNESLKQKKLADAVGPEIIKKIDRLLPAVLTGKTIEFDVKLYSNDRSIALHIDLVPVHQHDGPTHFLFHANYISSEQRQLSESLRKEEQKYHTLLDTLPAAIYTCDKDGRITYFNDVAASLWGHRPALNSDAIKFCAAYKVWMNGTFIPPHETPMAIAISCGKSYRNLEPVFERPDGTSFNAHVTIDPLYDKEGNIAGAINVFQDVTPLKKLEQARRESESKYNRLLKLLPAAVYSCDTDGHITYYNDVAAHLWSYTAEVNADLVKFCACCKVWREDGTPVTPENTPMAIAVKTGRSVRNEEVIIERPDGLKINASVSVEPIVDEKNNITGAINILQDITRIKQAELALRESEQQYKQVLELLPAAVYTVTQKVKSGYSTKQRQIYGEENPK